MAYTTPPAYTNAELLAHIRQAIVDVAAGGQNVMFMGKAVTRANLKDLIAAAASLEEVIDTDTAADAGGGIALVQYGERV